MSIDPKTTTSNTLRGKILGSSIFTSTANQPWYMNKIFLGSALFATAGGAVGFVSAKVVDGSQNFQDDHASANSIDLAHDTEGKDLNKDHLEEGPHILFTSSLPCGHPADSLDFGSAFKGQRAAMGQGGVFEYHGKYYNTYYKEEWDSMTDEQKHEYYLSIDSKIDYDKSMMVNSVHGETIEIPLSSINNDHALMHDPFIPESQVDEFIPFEYGKGSLESGPGAAHLDPEMDVPSTIIVHSYAFNPNEEDNEYEHIERNGSYDSDDLLSDNNMRDEEVHDYSHTIDMDTHHIVEVNKIHLVASDEEITIVDQNDIHHHFYTDDEDLFSTKIVENDHHGHSDLEDYHSHE